MNIDDLTVGQAKELAGKLACFLGQDTTPSPSVARAGHDKRPVIVCTDKRAVVFGYTTDADARPINLTECRMALYWSADVGGVFGLAEKGPTKDCKISATAPALTLEGVTAIFAVDPGAEKAWIAAKVQGR